MVYYDWNIDRYGYIWAGFLHSYVDKNTGKRVKLCPYIKHDLEDYADAAEDPTILNNTFFNDRAMAWSSQDMLWHACKTDDEYKSPYPPYAFFQPYWYNLTGDDKDIYLTADDFDDAFANSCRCMTVKLRPGISNKDLGSCVAQGNSNYVDEAFDDKTLYYIHSVNGCIVYGIDDTSTDESTKYMGYTWERLCWYKYAWYQYLAYIDNMNTLFSQAQANIFEACNYDAMAALAAKIPQAATFYTNLMTFFKTLPLPNTGEYPSDKNINFWLLDNPIRKFANTMCLQYEANPTDQKQGRFYFYDGYANKKYYLYTDHPDESTYTAQGVSGVMQLTNPVVNTPNGFVRLLPPNAGYWSNISAPVTYNMQKITAEYSDYHIPSTKLVYEHTDDVTACTTQNTRAMWVNLIGYEDGHMVYIKYQYQSLAWAKESLFVKALNIKPILTDNRPVDEILDEAMENPRNPWKTPTEYYADNSPTGQLPAGETGTGYVKARVVSKDEKDKLTVPTWWWSNSLANWCTFKKTDKYTTELFVWNGQNGWDKFSSIMLEPRFAGSSKIYYYYDITRFIKGATVKGKIHYDNLRYEYKSIKFIADTKFSQYDERNFQTVKLNKMYIAGKGTDRYPIADGIPVIMRLPSGEIEVLYKLKAPGMSKNTDIIYDDNIDFVNSVCKAYFGDGQEKTIREDWKRFYKIVNSGEEVATDIITDDDPSLVDADEINTIHENSDMFSISLTVPRQYPETGTSVGNDYVERWEK